MVALRNFEPKLTALDSSELLEVAVIGFNGPGILSGTLALQVGHEQVGGCPVVRVAVYVNGPKHLDQPISSQMQMAAIGWNSNFRHRAGLPDGLTDFPVTFQAGQPLPVVVADAFQVVQTAVPPVKCDEGRCKPACMGDFQHLPKIVIFVQSIVGFVVDAIVAR